MTIDNRSKGKFPCDKYGGKVLVHLPNGTGTLRSECFVTNMEIRSGASGGPVLRGNHIIGVNSASMEFLGNEEPVSFITPILKILDLKLEDGKGEYTNVKELIKNGNMPYVE
jgi:hypothetical protein